MCECCERTAQKMNEIEERGRRSSSATKEMKEEKHYEAGLSSYIILSNAQQFTERHKLLSKSAQEKWGSFASLGAAPPKFSRARDFPKESAERTLKCRHIIAACIAPLMIDLLSFSCS